MKRIPNIRFDPLPLLNCQKLHWLYQKQAFRITDRDADIVFHWDYANTKFECKVTAKYDSEIKFVNHLCHDVSKSHINELCKEIYGYGSEAVNGWAIEKNDEMNGVKDIRLIHLDDYERKPGYFYQKPLFRPDTEKVWETRLVIMGTRPVYKLMKQKSVNLGNIAGKVTAYAIMPYNEDKRIETFCERIGMDYGELDIMNFDGLDYIIDANPTPGDAAFVNMDEQLSAQFQWDYLELFKANYHV